MKGPVKRLIKGVLPPHVYVFLRRVLLDSWPYVPLKDYASLDKLVLFWRVAPNALQNYASLSNVYDLARQLERDRIGGAFVECGVWRGGCAAVMATVAQRAGGARGIWLFDSFEGMPEATAMDTGEQARELARGRMGGRLVPTGTVLASVDDVRSLFFEKLHLAEDAVFIVKGWFQDTLSQQKSRIGPIALLRIDADWYESTKVCLDTLYEQVVEGGYVIVDDYGWFPGCRRAVDEFIDSRKLDVELRQVDYTRVYFRKQSRR